MIKILLFVSFKYSNLLEFEGKIWILQVRQKSFTTKNLQVMTKKQQTQHGGD